MPNLSAEAWTALGTWVLVIGTLGAVWWQARQQRATHSASTVMKLRNLYDSNEMLMHRSATSSFVLKWYRDKSVSLDPAGLDFQVFSFFELTGILTHRGGLDKDMIWCEFCQAVVHYYAALKESGLLEKIRASKHGKDTTLFAETTWLNNKMFKMDRKKRRLGSGYHGPTEAAVMEYLDRESTKGKSKGSTP